MALHLTILGCGSSGGVPRVAQGWGKCDPNEPKNRRRRCSVLLEREGEGGTTRVLIDTSPDLREQLIDAGVKALDAVVFTHEHADHTHGIDDLRPLVIQNRRRIPIHADERTMAMLMTRFGYCFETPEGSDYPPILTAHLIPRLEHVSMKWKPVHRKNMRQNTEREHGFDSIKTNRALEPLVIEGAGGPISLLPFPLQHGAIEALGFRIGDLAYTPDVNAIPPESLAPLTGLQCWLIDALRDSPHPTHFSLTEALDWVARMKPQRAILTNLHTDLDYGRLTRDMPTGIVPAYDGMRIKISEETPATI